MVRYVRVVNRTRSRILADHAHLADTTWSRFWGLMGKRALARGDGLVLKPGGSIHMFFMRIPLDVLHVDGTGRVTHVLRGIKPWRVGPLLVGGALAIELPVGAAEGTDSGDEVIIEPVPESPSRARPPA